jgi:biofilm PGA synthesis N-glycosyltransferase PgaC
MRARLARTRTASCGIENGLGHVVGCAELGAYALAFSMLLWVIGKFVAMPEGLNVPSIQPPAFWGLLLATTCLIQFAVALRIESPYEHRAFGLIGWMIWYPFFFWILSLMTALAGFPKALLARRGKRATWVSPDRGLQ